jgi:hypothetical protein
LSSAFRRPGQAWDFKPLDKGGAQDNKYEGFGNANYMRTGHEGLGIDEGILRRAAGLMQEAGGLYNQYVRGRSSGHTGYDPAWGHFWQGPPYGDDPRDQAAMPSYPRR